MKVLVLNLSLIDLLVDPELTHVKGFSRGQKSANCNFFVSRALPASVEGTCEAILVNLGLLNLKASHRGRKFLHIFLGDVVESELICKFFLDIPSALKLVKACGLERIRHPHGFMYLYWVTLHRE